MGLTTQDLYIQKEYTELCNILKFRVILIGPLLNKIQPFKIFKICKEMYGFPDECPQNVWISGQVSAKCMDFWTSVRKMYGFPDKCPQNVWISGQVSGNPYICY